MDVDEAPQAPKDLWEEFRDVFSSKSRSFRPLTIKPQVIEMNATEVEARIKESMEDRRISMSASVGKTLNPIGGSEGGGKSITFGDVSGGKTLNIRMLKARAGVDLGLVIGPEGVHIADVDEYHNFMSKDEKELVGGKRIPARLEKKDLEQLQHRNKVEAIWDAVVAFGKSATKPFGSRE